MAILDYRTAGESHGQALIAVVEAMPAGVAVDVNLINAELTRRQGGFGQGSSVMETGQRPNRVRDRLCPLAGHGQPA